MAGGGEGVSRLDEARLSALARRIDAAHADAAEVGIPDERYDAGLSIPEARALVAEVRSLQNDLLAESVKTDEVMDAENAGSQLTAEKLLEIARTGEHPGVFGGATIEACAQAILRLRATLEHYADEATWNPSPTRTDGSRCVYRGTNENGYDLARDALGGSGEGGTPGV
jgi:hypothetical protein